MIQIRLTQQTSFSAVITVNLVRVADIPLHLLHTSPDPPPMLDHTVNHAIKKSLRKSTSVMGIVISYLYQRVKRSDLSIQIRMSFRPQYRLFFHCHIAQADKLPFLLMYDIS